MPRSPSRIAVVVLTVLMASAMSTTEVAADAEATTKSRTVLRKRPARRGRVVARVPAKRSVSVIERKGKWTRVRYRRRTGWVLSTRLELAETAGPSAQNVVRTKPQKRLTSIETPLFANPGESSKHIAVIPAGTSVRSDARSGRWVRVRHGKRRGWIARSTLEADVAKLPSRKPGASRFSEKHSIRAGNWEKRSDLHDARTVEVTAPTPAHQNADGRSSVIFRVVAGQSVVATGRRDGDWVLIQRNDGIAGWVPSASVRTKTVSADALGEEVVSSRDADLDHSPAVLLLRDRFRVGVAARTGLMSLSQRFLSDGTTALSEYRVTANAAEAQTGADLSYRVVAGLRVGIDLRYSIAVGAPGIRYRDESGALEPVSFSLQTGRLSARVGYELSTARATTIHARVGYHLQWFQIDELVNPGLLGRESLVGETFGLGVDSALGETLLVGATTDALVSGERVQTPGLEDGEHRKTIGLWGDVRVSYVGFGRTSVEASYGLAWAVSRWTGPSMRQPDVSNAERTDTAHHLLLGLGRVF